MCRHTVRWSQRQKLKLRVSGGKHTASSGDLLSLHVLQRNWCQGFLGELSACEQQVLDSLEGTLSELDENSNQESWGPSWYVSGMKVKNSAREIPQETEQLIWLPPLYR